MTVGTSPTWIDLPGNGAATVFSFPFLISVSTDLLVGFIASGVYASQASGYTIQGIGNSGGGQVTFAIAPPLGTTVDLRSKFQFTQPTNFANLGGYLPENTTNSMDRVTSLVKILARQTYAFGIHGPDNENTQWPALPPAAQRVGGALIFDANGLPTLGVPVTGTISTGTLAPFLNLSQSAAEASAGVTPSALQYAEGDIRRYGAIIGATDNSTAINAALLVSAVGGNAAFIPQGVWNYTSTLVTGNSSFGASSMYGCGRQSILAPSVGIDGLTFVGDALFNPAASRYFRDFSLIGPSTTASNNSGILFPNGINARLGGILFSGLTIQNFGYGVNLQISGTTTGLWASMFLNCYLFNNFYGYRFFGLSITNTIYGGYVQNNTMTAPAGGPTSYSMGISCDLSGGGNSQGMVVNGVNIYNYAVGISFNLTLYMAVTDCAISVCTIHGIEILSLQGGTFFKGCWVQIANTAAANNCIAIYIEPIGTPVYDKIVIEGCNLVGSAIATGTMGIAVGIQQNGVTLRDNTVGSAATPFVTGISGTVGGGAAGANVVIEGNTIFATGVAISAYLAATNASIGPNAIQSGTPLTLPSGTPPGLIYLQPNVPMSGTAVFAASTSVTVTFANQMPNAGYFISLGGNAAGFVWAVNKSPTGFIINCSASNSNPTDWSVSYN